MNDLSQFKQITDCIWFIENGLIANNRLILLDPPLIFFTAATTLMWMNFYNQRRK